MIHLNRCDECGNTWKDNSPLVGIDYSLLKKQKITLLEVMNKLDGSKEKDLEGLLNLIDSIQDYAVDTLGLEEKEVFNLSQD